MHTGQVATSVRKTHRLGLSHLLTIWSLDCLRIRAQVWILAIDQISLDARDLRPHVVPRAECCTVIGLLTPLTGSSNI